MEMDVEARVVCQCLEFPDRCWVLHLGPAACLAERFKSTALEEEGSRYNP